MAETMEPLLEKGKKTQTQEEESQLKTPKEEEVKDIVATGFSYFRRNVNLAVSMGFWITVFCIPVCSKVTQDFIFDKKEGGLDIPELLLSRKEDMIAQWPTVFTLMFFMVSKNTGTTVSNCWSALVGIVVSTVNIAILNFFFPLGGECVTGKISNQTIATGLRQYCEEYRDPNYASAWGWAVWLDFFLFLGIELASNSAEGTMKFGLCWHMGYMMNFMKFDGFKFSLSQVITALLGLLLAILVTIVPTIFSVMAGNWFKFPFVITFSLGDFPEELTEKVSDAWKNTIHFLHKSPDLDRHTRTSMRFAIDAKIDAIQPVVNRMVEYYEASWWEKFLFVVCCRPHIWENDRQHVKRFIDGFGDNIGGVDDILYMAKKVILSDEHDNYAGLADEEREATMQEREMVQEEMFALAAVVAEHLKEIATRDNEYNEQETIEEIGKKQQALRDAYMKVRDLDLPTSSRARRRLRNQFACLVFGLLCYSCQVKTTFGTRTASKAKTAKMNGRQTVKNYVMDTFGERTDKGYKMFWHKYWYDIDKKMFVGRNFVSIGTCFVLGNFFKGNVFDGFNPNMAVTLAILVSHFPGTAFETNLTRLLGLTLGKVLPIIMMAVVSLSGERTSYSTIFHLVMIWIYESFFAFINYTSKEWGPVACLVAGFGCGALVGTRSTNWSDTIFRSQYMEIGQVTGAIMIQMTVDVVDTTLRRRWPRDTFVKNMAKLGMRVDKEAIKQWNMQDEHERGTAHAMTDMDGELVNSFEAFMDAKSAQTLKPMLESITKTKALIVEQENLLGECSPRSVIVRGPRTPFKLDASTEAMIWIRRLVHEMELLYMVYDKGPVATGTPAPYFIHCLHLDKEFQKAVLMALRITFMDLQSLLEYDKDGFINRRYKGNPKMINPEMHWKIDDHNSDSGTQMDFEHDLCVCVAQRALFDALNHVAEIQHICYSTGKFDYEQFDLTHESSEV